MFEQLIVSLVAFFWWLDYMAIFILMAMESSLFPVPSELVMIPAWYLSFIGTLNPFYVTLVWWLWSLFWAFVNYFIIGKLIGKPFIERYGKYFFITHSKYKMSEELFLKNDKLYTFIGRLIPVVRHLISIPAGIFSMKITPFAVLTFLGATLWCSILVLIWYVFWESIIERFRQYTHEIGIILTIWIIIWTIWKLSRKKK